MTLIDDFSRKLWIYFMREKSEVFTKFKIWRAEVEKEQGRSVKCLRSDNGGEYTSREFQDYCDRSVSEDRITFGCRLTQGRYSFHSFLLSRTKSGQACM